MLRHNLLKPCSLCLECLKSLNVVRCKRSEILAPEVQRLLAESALSGRRRNAIGARLPPNPDHLLFRKCRILYGPSLAEGPILSGFNQSENSRAGQTNTSNNLILKPKLTRHTLLLRCDFLIQCPFPATSQH